MRVEKDFIGEVSLPEDALYGIHSYRASSNFPAGPRFPVEWYKAVGQVKQSCYQTVINFREAVNKEYPDQSKELRLPHKEILETMMEAAGEVMEGKYFDFFIIPAVQGGAGTSINLNVNEIIANVALKKLGHKPGDYSYIDPIESVNIYQSTNDVIPTALTIAIMRLLNVLEEKINITRQITEKLETKYRNTLRLAYTQMQEAVPSTFGQLFSTYSEALSRDWWRVSKAYERIKVVNLGGGATGTGIGIPRYYIMEVVQNLKKATGLPVTQGENLPDATSNSDRFVEVHAILKSHAVNLEKTVSDLRLLASGVSGEKEIILPDKQVGSSIMPGKVNPVIPEYVISGAHQIYSNDQVITSFAGQGCLELNAYLPGIGAAMIQSLNLLIAMNDTISKNLLDGLVINEKAARNRLMRTPSVTTALSPLIGYNIAAQLARYMKEKDVDIVNANKRLKLIDEAKLMNILKPEYLLKKGFSMKDISEFNRTD